MTNPPRDTECTDVPEGPKAETWLAQDVRDAVLQHERVSQAPASWAVTGYSTGAFCAVKLVLAHPACSPPRPASAATTSRSPTTRPATSSAARETRYDDNSPLWLYGRTGLAVGPPDAADHRPGGPGQLRRDAEDAGRHAGRPGRLVAGLPTGGHNYRNYAAAMPDVLRWLGQGGFGA